MQKKIYISTAVYPREKRNREHLKISSNVQGYEIKIFIACMNGHNIGDVTTCINRYYI